MCRMRTQHELVLHPHGVISTKTRTTPVVVLQTQLRVFARIPGDAGGDAILVDRQGGRERVLVTTRDVAAQAQNEERLDPSQELRVHAAGIDPMARPDQRDAWLLACARNDGGRM